jgi:hypothetical protein
LKVGVGAETNSFGSATLEKQKQKGEQEKINNENKERGKLNRKRSLMGNKCKTGQKLTQKGFGRGKCLLIA